MPLLGCTSGENMTVKDLLFYLLVHIVKHGFGGEVWLGNEKGLTNECVGAWLLNRNDLLLEVEEHDRNN